MSVSTRICASSPLCLTHHFRNSSESTSRSVKGLAPAAQMSATAYHFRLAKTRSSHFFRLCSAPTTCIFNNIPAEVCTLRKRTLFQGSKPRAVTPYVGVFARFFIDFGLARTIGGLISAFQQCGPVFQQTKYCLPSSSCWTWNRLASQPGHRMCIRILRLFRPALGRLLLPKRLFDSLLPVTINL